MKGYRVKWLEAAGEHAIPRETYVEAENTREAIFEATRCFCGDFHCLNIDSVTPYYGKIWSKET